jgi:hypothetical protein
MAVRRASQLNTAAIVVGLGLGITFLVLEIWFQSTPLWLEILILSIGVVLILAGWRMGNNSGGNNGSSSKKQSQSESPNAQQAQSSGRDISQQHAGRDLYHAARDININTQPSITSPQQITTNLSVKYDSHQWGDDDYIGHEEADHFLRVSVHLTPTTTMQVARATLHLMGENLEARGFTPRIINTPETQSFRFYVPPFNSRSEILQGKTKATLTILAATKLWTSDKFELDVPKPSWIPENFSIIGESKKSSGAPESQPTIHVESHGQQGGITAGIVNIHGDAKPKVKLSDTTEQKTPKGYLYEATLSVETQYAIPEIKVTAHAASIQSLDIVPQRSGMQMFGHSGKRDGYHFKTVLNIAGKYKIRVTTAKAEDVKIDLE